MRQTPLFSTRESPDSISGTIDHFTFRAEGSDFVIFRLLDDAGRAITAKGALGFAREGEMVLLRGKWEDDPRWGRQFHFRSYEVRRPTTKDGLRKYLGSGLVEGVGKSYAEKLVEHFGEDLFDVVENEPERLREVPGIGRKRAAQITEALGGHRRKRRTQVELLGFGLSSAHAAELIKRYESGAVEAVQANPYMLASEIRGIGFQTADRIAGTIGIARDAPLRIKAALRHSLHELSLQGDTVVPVEELLDHTTEMLGLDRRLIEDQVLDARREGTIELWSYDGIDYLGLPRLIAAERRIAIHLGQRLAARDVESAGFQQELEAAVGIARDCAGAMELDLNEQQSRGIGLALCAPVSVITGGPGVGKTTALRVLVRVLRDEGRALALCAPTGRAAKRLEEATGESARTIHRLLEFQPRGGFERGEQNPLDEEVVVVDEVSMLDARLAGRLVSALRPEARLVLVGDKDQLPSVGPGAVLRDLLESGVVPAVELTEVFRQAAGSAIVRNAHRIQQGRLPELEGRRRSDWDGPGQGDFYFVERDSALECARTLVHIVKRRIPEAYGLDPIRDVQVLVPMHRGVCGTKLLNERLQAALNPQEQRLVKGDKVFGRGDKVMQLRNDYERDVFNGDIGIVSALDLEQTRLVVNFSGREVTYRKGELDGLTLCYAATIHKSQGSEFPAVVMPLLMDHFLMLKRNLLYTGLTRARRLVMLLGQRAAVERAIGDDEMHQRRSTLGCLLAPGRDAWPVAGPLPDAGLAGVPDDEGNRALAMAWPEEDDLDDVVDLGGAIGPEGDRERDDRGMTGGAE